MGRAASHITLECALQTHPNITIIGEEVASVSFYSPANFVVSVLDIFQFSVWKPSWFIIVIFIVHQVFRIFPTDLLWTFWLNCYVLILMLLIFSLSSVTLESWHWPTWSFFPFAPFFCNCLGLIVLFHMSPMIRLVNWLDQVHVWVSSFFGNPKSKNDLDPSLPD